MFYFKSMKHKLSKKILYFKINAINVKKTFIKRHNRQLILFADSKLNSIFVLGVNTHTLLLFYSK